jgi:hypothetical protein
MNKSKRMMGTESQTKDEWESRTMNKIMNNNNKIEQQ